MEQTLNKPQKKEVLTALQFVKKQFPIEKEQGEKRVKYNSVGKDRFRIDFWSMKDKDLVVSRSYYVVLTKKKNTWEYEIL